MNETQDEQLHDDTPAQAEQRDRWREAKAQYGDSIPAEVQVLLLEGELARVHARMLRMRDEHRKRGVWKNQVKTQQAKQERHYKAIRDENGRLWERLRRHADAAKIVRLLDYDAKADSYTIEVRTLLLLGLQDSIDKLRGEPTAQPPTYQGKRDGEETPR